MIFVKRYAYWPFGTFGYITFGEGKGFSLEHTFVGRHAPNAKPPIYTCLPEGDYVLEPHNSVAHPDTWALVNPVLKVYHYAFDGMPEGAWTVCLLHPASLESQLEGCIAQGKALAFINGTLGVTGSVDTYGLLHDYIKQSGDLNLRIENATGEPWPTT